MQVPRLLNEAPIHTNLSGARWAFFAHANRYKRSSAQCRSFPFPMPKSWKSPCDILHHLIDHGHGCSFRINIKMPFQFCGHRAWPAWNIRWELDCRWKAFIWIHFGILSVAFCVPTVTVVDLSQKLQIPKRNDRCCEIRTVDFRVRQIVVFVNGGNFDAFPCYWEGTRWQANQKMQRKTRANLGAHFADDRWNETVEWVVCSSLENMVFYVSFSCWVMY